jgi:hypothetical protein
MMVLKEYILMNTKKLEMVNSIKDSGIRKQVKEMVSEYNFGLMDLSMKVCGEEIKQVEEVE